MNKEQFLSALKEKLKGLSKEDAAERLAFYSEAIDDRMEEGLTEEEAVAQLDSAEEIAQRIQAEVPVSQPIKEKRRLSALEIVMLVLGSPIWISLLAAAFAVVVSLYAAFWSVMISLWAAELSVTVGAMAGFVGACIFCFTGSVPAGLAFLSVGLFCAGLAIFGFYGCLAGTKGLGWLTKKTTLWLVRLFTRKGGKK